MDARQPCKTRSLDRGKPPVCIDARTLFGDAHEVRIRFNGDEYRLRITRNDKLILTK